METDIVAALATRPEILGIVALGYALVKMKKRSKFVYITMLVGIIILGISLIVREVSSLLLGPSLIEILLGDYFYDHLEIVSNIFAVLL